MVQCGTEARFALIILTVYISSACSAPQAPEARVEYPPEIQVQADEQVEQSAREVPWSRVNVSEPFRQALFQHPALMHGGVDVVRLATGEWYIIGVGITGNKALESGSPRARVDTIRVAQIRSHQEIVRHFEVTIVGQLSIHESSYTSSGGDAVSETRIDERITEHTQGVIRHFVSIGSWYSADEEIFYYASALRVEPHARVESGADNE